MEELINGLAIYNTFLALVNSRSGINLSGDAYYPGTYYFIWMGVAATIVSCILFFIPSLSWLSQVLVFAVLSLLTIVLLKNIKKVIRL